jgi:uncharacterized protein YcaQ
MKAVRISRQTMRRFVLGKAGLYPGRRWNGMSGALQALTQTGSVQIDPVHVIARNHDLILFSRVADYKPEHLNRLAYEKRACFDYGNTLFMYPMEEIPYWRVVMRWWDVSPWIHRLRHNHPAATDTVRAELRARGPLAQRDMVGTKVDSYRARKDTGLALYYLWLIGELMTHSRRGFDRVYYFSDEIVPPEHQGEATVEEAEAYFARKVFVEMGLCTRMDWLRRFRVLMARPVDSAEARSVLGDLETAGVITAVSVEGQKTTSYVLTSDLPLLDELERGVIPSAWKPLGSTTETETVFLAPLDMVSARGRALPVFDFEYIWEIYKPQHQRRWGYYTLPILYGDRLVGRIDSRMNRSDHTLVVNGLWLEEDTLARSPEFADALAAGFERFARFHHARQVDVSSVGFVPLKRRMAKVAKSLA